MQSTCKGILFFDGDCGLCNRAVRFLLRRDKCKRIYFAPLQGTTAQTIVPLEYRDSLSTVVYHRTGADRELPVHIKSDAILLALTDIGGFWRLVARFMRMFPVCFRNMCYDRIANNRKRFFKQAACALPTKEEHARILP